MLKLSSKNVALLAAFAALASQAQAAPAPPLSSVSVIKVVSSAGSENTSSGQISTTIDHTSVGLKVTVREIGYGSYDLAKMNGSTIPNSNSTTTYLCGSASYPTTCSPGQSIIGFDNTYTVTGYSSGQFTFQSTGTNGGGTKSTYINIK